MVGGFQRGLRLRTSFGSARRSASTCAIAKTSIIRSIQSDIKSKNMSAEEVVKQYLATVARIEPTVAGFITIDDENALRQVRCPWMMVVQPQIPKISKEGSAWHHVEVAPVQQSLSWSHLVAHSSAYHACFHASPFPCPYRRLVSSTPKSRRRAQQTSQFWRAFQSQSRSIILKSFEGSLWDFCSIWQV